MGGADGVDWTLDKVKNYAIDGGLALKLETLKHYL
jgi:hypothetical protein